MDRIIKFRAWHKSEKVMGNIKTLTDKGAFVLGVAMGKDQVSDNGKSIVYAPTDGRFCHNDEIELMQFTGLKDKNGKEIYCKDFFKTIAGKIPDKIDESSYGWSLFYWDYTNKRYIESQDTFEHREVIGNIHENKELLK